MRVFVTIGIDVDGEDGVSAEEVANEFEWYIRNHCIPNFDGGPIYDAVVSMIR